MNILVLTEQWFPDFLGGSGRVATDTAVGLARAGHAVTVIAPEHRSGERVTEPVPGLRLLRVARRLPGVPQTVTDPLAYRRRVHMLTDRFDVAIAHQPSGVEALRTLGIPVVFVFHASGVREARHRRALGLSVLEAVKSLVVEQPAALIERRSLPGADRVLVLSEFSRSLLLTDHPTGGEKVVVAGGGVDTDVFSPAFDRAALRRTLRIPDATRVLVTVRRLVARTGVENLIDAYERIAVDDPSIDLVVIGEGEQRTQLEARVERGGLTGRVRFLGRLTDADVLRWYRAADLFVLPTVAYEGFGLSTAEALACGTPVVGTPVGATPELLKALDPARVSASARPSDLAATILATLPTLGETNRAAARAHAVAKLSLGAMVDRWVEAIEPLAQAA